MYTYSYFWMGVYVFIFYVPFVCANINTTYLAIIDVNYSQLQ